MITTNQMSYEDMKQTVADGYNCGQCGGLLSVAWGGSSGINGYILRCVNDIEHNTINRHDVEREQKIQQIKEIRKLDSNALMNMDENKMLARVNMAKFPADLSPTEKKLLAQVAMTYGFDPLMGEITIYQGRPFVSIDGRYRKAQETGLLGGVETRPATKQEKADWGIPEADYFFRAEVYVKGAERPFVGWGRVRTSETKGAAYLPVVNNSQRMAEKRAEAQALRKAFSIPLPSAEDIGTPDIEEPHPAIEAEVIDDMPESLKPQPQSDKDFEEMESASLKAEQPPAPVKPKIDKELKGLIDKIVNGSVKMGYTTKQVADLIAVKFGPGLKTIDLNKKQCQDLITAIERGEGLSE